MSLAAVARARAHPCAMLLGLAALLARAPPAAADAPQFVDQDRLTLSASGSTLNDASGGGTGTLGWLHYFTPDALIGVAGEYDTIANSHWAFGSLSGSISGGPTNTRWTFAAEAHRGSGDIGTEPFDYAVEAIDAGATFNRTVSLLLETRQFDIYTTHGNLPKAGLSWLASPHVQLGVSYAHSVSGNLGTELTTARVDHYGQSMKWFLGGAFGHAAPAIVNLQTGALGPAPSYREGFGGIGTTLGRTEWTLAGDYLHIGVTKRITLTLSCIIHLESSGGARG